MLPVGWRWLRRGGVGARVAKAYRAAPVQAKAAVCVGAVGVDNTQRAVDIHLQARALSDDPQLSGLTGFVVPTPTNLEERDMFARLVQIPWSSRLLREGNTGGHSSTSMPWFVAAEVVPWLR